MTKMNIEKASVEKVAVERATVEKVANTTFTSVTPKNVALAALTTGAAIMMSNGVSYLSNLIGDRLERPKYDRVFEKALELNPKLKSYDRTSLRKYFDLVIDASPVVAKNPLLVSNWLQYMLDHEGSMNFMAYKQLVDLQSSVNRNKLDMAPASAVMKNTLIEGAVRASLPQVQYKADLSRPPKMV